jgi:hypothetical protein
MLLLLGGDRAHGFALGRAGTTSSPRQGVGGGGSRSRSRTTTTTTTTSPVLYTRSIKTRQPTSRFVTPRSDRSEDNDNSKDTDDTDRPKTKDATAPPPPAAVPIVWPSARRLGVDAVAILLAMEVVGLLASINIPAFGGWWAPLPSLVVQGGLLTKVLQGWLWNTALWTTALSFGSSASPRRTSTTDSSSSPFASFLPTFGIYAAGRLGGAALLAVSVGTPLDWTAVLAPALLDLYTVGLLLGVARYLWGDDE